MMRNAGSLLVALFAAFVVMIAAVWIATYMTEYVPFSGLGAEFRYRSVLALPWIAGGLTLGVVAGWLVVTNHPYRWAFFLALIVAAADAFTLRNIHAGAASTVLKAGIEVVLGAAATWLAFVRIARRADDPRTPSGVAG